MNHAYKVYIFFTFVLTFRICLVKTRCALIKSLHKLTGRTFPEYLKENAFEHKIILPIRSDLA